MKILAIIQARLSSTRLPNKVLKTIIGKSMLEHQIERISFSKYIDKIIVATSKDNGDNDIEKMCNRINIDCFRGDLDNVLDRFYQASILYNPEHIVRLTGDCPLIDSGLIDDLIEFYIKENCDYASNCNPSTLPDGLDAEVFSFKTLKNVWEKAKLPSELEHVTIYIRNHPEGFKIASWKYFKDLSYLRFTVDEEEDLEFVKKIFENLYMENHKFNLKDILFLLEKDPDLIKINNKFVRNEGLLKSLKKDQEYLNKIEINK